MLFMAIIPGGSRLACTTFFLKRCQGEIRDGVGPDPKLAADACHRSSHLSQDAGHQAGASFRKERDGALIEDGNTSRSDGTR